MRSAVLAVLLALVASGVRAGAGMGFGESMLMHMDAPSAGTGGLPLEKFTNPDSEVYTDQSYLTAGVRWVGLGVEVGLFSALRLGFEGVMVSVNGADQTEEDAAGAYAGTLGKMDASETALRGSLQWNIGSRDIDVYARFEMEQFSQEMAGYKSDGMGTSGSLFGIYRVNESWNILGWGAGGPFGEDKRFDFVSSVSGGAGIEHPGGMGLIGGKEGVRLGAEFGQVAGERSAGAGLVYWFGGRDLDGTGVRVAIRAGYRGEAGMVSPSQGRFGCGVTYRDDLGIGWGADYGFVPFGDLGTVHYLSARIKLGLGFARHADDTRGEYGGEDK